MSNTTAAPAAKIRAAVWTRTDKTSWNVEYNGYSFAGIKTAGTWSLIVWNEIADDWADAYVTEETALRAFWNAVTAWLPRSDYVTPNPLKGYVVPAETELEQPADPAWGDQGDDSEHVDAAVASIIAEREADAAIQLAEAEGTDECPKCHQSGAAKCVTKSGKAVKENGGYHAVRPGHAK
jgi:hypothetical protein